jgi:hypothetical protein
LTTWIGQNTNCSAFRGPAPTSWHRFAHLKQPIRKLAAARNGSGPQLSSNHPPLYAPVPKPTIETGVTAMTLAVLSAFDQHARGK